MLHILFSILISIGSVSGFVVKDGKSLEKKHDTITHEKVLLDVGEDINEW